MKVRNQFNGKCFPIVPNASKKKIKQTTSKHAYETINQRTNSKVPKTKHFKHNKELKFK